MGSFATIDNGYTYENDELTSVSKPIRFKIKDNTPNDAFLTINLTVTAKNDMDELGLNYIETNLSVVQLSDYELADKYLEIIERNKIDAKYINLEITETAGIEQINSLMDNLQKLKSNGISLSLDDYGTGYSNLNYVVSMPVQIIKFDKKMTDEYFAGSKAKFVMDYSIRMFKAMDLKIVSEGVETKIQLDSLAELGVDYIQGYYFSKPLPMDEFIEFIKNKKNVEV